MSFFLLYRSHLPKADLDFEASGANSVETQLFDEKTLTRLNVSAGYPTLYRLPLPSLHIFLFFQVLSSIQRAICQEALLDIYQALLKHVFLVYQSGHQKSVA